MPIILTDTRTEGQTHGLKCLVYGLPGVGKTKLAETLPNPVIISRESGLLSLRKKAIPVIKISTLQDWKDAYAFVMYDPRAAHFESVCLDSVSEIAEVVLGEERMLNADKRAVYGEMFTKVIEQCRMFRDIPGKHVYFSATQSRSTNDVGQTLNVPGMPGKQLPLAVPFLFDLVMCLRAEEDAEGTIVRKLQTQPSFGYIAKDRSGALDMFEDPHLGNIFNKIIGAQ